MSQMKYTLRPVRVVMTLGLHLIETILCWQVITLHLHLKERLKLNRNGADQYLTPAAKAPQLLQLLQIKCPQMY